MFETGSREGKPALLLDGRALLTVNGVALFERGGERLEQDIKETAHGGCRGEGEGSSFELSTEVTGSCAALRLSARLEHSKPLFAKGRYLDGGKSAGVGVVLEGFRQAVAIYQHKDWWLRPAFCDIIEQVPARTQLLLLRRDNGYCAVVAVADNLCRCDIEGGETLELSISSNSGELDSLDELFCVISAGDDPYRCCEEACATAMRLTGKSYPMKKEKKLPEMLEYLGWCSWDAFYHKVDEAGLLNKMEELRDKKIPARWVLIDDGWLDADYQAQKLKNLQADKKKFPGGLEQTTRLLKERYGIKQVGVWHAIMGYWNGLEADSPAEKELGRYCRHLPDGRVIPDCEAHAAFGFWNGWHSFLRRCGIDFVKVDGQSAVTNYNWGRNSFGQASRGSHTALEASCAINFNGNLINCMGMAPEDIWNRPNSAVSRNSDDFVPFTANGFREHAIQNAYNTLLHGQFYYGDWDMFWSDHEESLANSMLRAVSGGPVYISDQPGKSNRELIMPLALESGRLLRCEDIALPTLDCLFADPVGTGRPLKLFNSRDGAWLVALFNIGEAGEPATAELRRGDIPALPQSLWVYDYLCGIVSRLEGEDAVSVELLGGGADTLLLVPRDERPAIIGDVSKYLSTAAVERVLWQNNCCHVFMEEQSALSVAFAGGEIAFHSGGKELTAARKGDLYTVAREDISDRAVEIAWGATQC